MSDKNGETLPVQQQQSTVIPREREFLIKINGALLEHLQMAIRAAASVDNPQFRLAAVNIEQTIFPQVMQQNAIAEAQPKKETPSDIHQVVADRIGKRRGRPPRKKSPTTAA